MIISGLDLGATSNPWPKFQPGQTVGSQMVEGSYTVVWPRGGTVKKQTVSFMAKAWQSIGGASANTTAAARYLARQLEQLALNRDQQPVYIQWWATADPVAALNSASHHDGWYVIDSLLASYDATIISGLVKVQMTVTQVAPGVPARQAVWVSGASLSSTYSAASQTLVGFPKNAANQPATALTRTGGEGGVPVSASPAANLNPLPFTPSSTVADWFVGGCHIYDTINTGSNPVPVAGGTYVNANWVEVFGADHRFEGDTFVTNGLLGLLIQTGQARIARAYLWSTGLATPTWQQVADLVYNDTGSNAGTVRAYDLRRVGREEVALIVSASTSANKWGQVTLRLGRGHYFARADLKPLSESNTIVGALAVVAANSLKFAYSTIGGSDPAVAASTIGTATDYGFVAGYTNNAAQPFIVGGLSQAQTTKMAPTNTSTVLGISDTDGPAQNVIRSYGIFAVPFGVNGTYSPANTQAEAEGGTLTGGFVSAADAGSSGGNVAKLPSGTAAGAKCVFGTLWTPPAGVYYAFWRFRVTAAASNASECKLSVINGSGASLGSVTFGSSLGAQTSYFIYNSGPFQITLDGSTSVQFQADSIALSAASTNWLIDEAFLVPVKLTGTYTAPADIWSQYNYDSYVEWGPQ